MAEIDRENKENQSVQFKDPKTACSEMRMLL